MEELQAGRDAVNCPDRAPHFHRPMPEIIMRMDPKSRKKVEVESASCGCSVGSNKSHPKRRNLRKIWPLFKSLPSDFAPVRRLRTPAGAARASSTSFSPLQRRRAVEVNGGSRDAFDISEVLYRQSQLQHRERSRPVTQTLSDSDDTIDPHIIPAWRMSDFPSSSSQGLHEPNRDSYTDLHSEMHSSSRRLDSKLRSSSPRTWNLSTALEREFERLGIPCDRKTKIPPQNKVVSIVSEDWATELVREGKLQRSAKVSSCAPSTARHFDQHSHFPNGLFPLEHKGSTAEVCDENHSAMGSVAVENRFLNPVVASFESIAGLRAEDLSAVSVSQFQSVMEKADVSLQRFSSSLIKAKRRLLERSTRGAVAQKFDVVAQMLQPLMPDVKFASPHHFKYGIQACINEAVFQQFETQSYGVRPHRSYPKAQLRQAAFLKEFYVLESIPAEELTDSASAEFDESFHHFCNKKLQAVQTKIGWVGRWPSKLSQVFLQSMKRVWMAHKLAFAFEKPATMFYVNGRAHLDPNYMDPLIYQLGTPDELSLFHVTVQFTVFPGFALGDGVVHSTVYLKPKLGIRTSDHGRC